jgi:hypothetical protein
MRQQEVRSPTDVSLKVRYSKMRPLAIRPFEAISLNNVSRSRWFLTMLTPLKITQRDDRPGRSVAARGRACIRVPRSCTKCAKLLCRGLTSALWSGSGRIVQGCIVQGTYRLREARILYEQTSGNTSIGKQCHWADGSAWNYRHGFRENKPKTHVFYDWIRAFWACFHENAGL